VLDRFNSLEPGVMWSAQLAVPVLGKGVTLALTARLWSMDGLAHAVWQKNLRWMVQMMCLWMMAF